MRLPTLVTAVAAFAAWDFGLSSASEFIPARPPAIPLAVRSPYLNAWLPGDSGGILPGNWPAFWTLDHVLEWQGYVTVDGQTYTWMGAAPGESPLATQTSLEYTSTKSIFTFDIGGKVTLTVTFLSPVFPNDPLQQSQQFSYITASAVSADHQNHGVQIYMDVSGALAAGNVDWKIQWDQTSTQNVTYHAFKLDQEQPFSEKAEVASWGRWYFAAEETTRVSFGIGEDTIIRDQFVAQHVLGNAIDTNYRGASDNTPVFALAYDLGQVGSTAQNALFMVGLEQDYPVQLAGSQGNLLDIPALWNTTYSLGTDDAMIAFFKDYDSVQAEMTELDSRIQEDSKKAGGQDYATITTLSVRQAYGALQVAGKNEQGDPQYFVKGMSLTGASTIQPVDIIYSMSPLLLYLNATQLRYILLPLMYNQRFGQYPEKYAEIDLGTFPVAQGHLDDSGKIMPIETSGDMLIMSLALAQKTNDKDFLSVFYTFCLSDWANYLGDSALIPGDQLSTDDFVGTLANQTNLALKGIIAMRAMSEIAKLTGNKDDWGQKATDLLAKWTALAITGAEDKSLPHARLTYDEPDSYGILYNIYADKLLGLNFLPQDLFDQQSAFYASVTTEKYGMALDTRFEWSRSDWQMWAAAVASKETRELFVKKLAAYIDETSTPAPMADLFDVRTGDYPSGGGGGVPRLVARPTVGGTFALLALPEAG